MTRLLLALLLVLPGCASWRGLPTRMPACDGPLVASDAVGPDFVARERYRVTRAGETLRLDLAVQKHQGVLMVVGFDPLGPKLFQVVQRDREVSVEAMPRAVVGVPPRNVLHDLHRARFGASDDAEVTHENGVATVRNARCESESRLERISWQALP